MRRAPRSSEERATTAALLQPPDGGGILAAANSLTCTQPRPQHSSSPGSVGRRRTLPSGSWTSSGSGHPWPRAGAAVWKPPPRWCWCWCCNGSAGCSWPPAAHAAAACQLLAIEGCASHGRARRRARARPLAAALAPPMPHHAALATRGPCKATDEATRCEGGKRGAPPPARGGEVWRGCTCTVRGAGGVCSCGVRLERLQEQPSHGLAAAEESTRSLGLRPRCSELLWEASIGQGHCGSRAPPFLASGDVQPKCACLAAERLTRGASRDRSARVCFQAAFWLIRWLDQATALKYGAQNGKTEVGQLPRHLSARYALSLPLLLRSLPKP